MTVASPSVVIPAPELRGAILEIAKCPDLEIGIDGPAGTGKTFGTLYFIHVLMLRYPGAKWLVSRKHNTDLAGSAMATYRESVLDPREGVSYFGGNKVEPAAYRYPNGSRLIVNGLDKPGKVRSMDFDGIYINEATECALDDIEFCHMRLARRAKSTLPQRYQHLIMDFNPDRPTHTLNQRMNSGLTKRLLSRHEDNPFLWDIKTQDWTEAGRRYIDLLNQLTGVRLARYRYGIWAAADGTVYEDSWDRSRNVVDPFPIPVEWPRYLIIDFGFTHPFVCLWAAEDPDGRFVIYREIYMTKRLVEDHAKEIKRLSRWGQPGGDPLPRQIITDHDAEDRGTLERHLGMYTTPAYKSVSAGIQAVASRLKPAGDGKPRLAYFNNMLTERDRDLAEKKLPTSTIEEYDSYVWKQGGSGKDEPVKEYDHGCFVAGTLVTTDQRDVPIERIKAGDRVLTRNGYRPVKDAGMTKRNAEVFTVTFSNGTALTGTSNHPVYVRSRGYIPLHALRYGDIIEDINLYKERYPLTCQSLQQKAKPSFTKELSLDVILSQRTGQTRVIIDLTRDILGRESKPFMLKSGRMLMDLSLMAVKSIIRMKTHRITHSTIWNVSRQKITRRTMLRTCLQSGWSNLGNISKRYDIWHQHGTSQKKAGRGIELSLKCRGRMQSIGRMFASRVGLNFNHAQCKKINLNSALIIASLHGGVNQASIILPLPVSSVTLASQPINTANQDFARKNVESWHNTLIPLWKKEFAPSANKHLLRNEVLNKRIAQGYAQAVTVESISKNKVHQDVYNLTVDNAVGEGEYFANGILVHNCDCSRYLCAKDLQPDGVSYVPSIWR